MPSPAYACQVLKAQKKKPPLYRSGGFSINSLTMSYFHTGIRTIIGAEAFHGPVRDGKEWDHLAMVIRHNFRPLLLPAAEPIRRVGRSRGESSDTRSRPSARRTANTCSRLDDQ